MGQEYQTGLKMVKVEVRPLAPSNRNHGLMPY